MIRARFRLLHGSLGLFFGVLVLSIAQAAEEPSVERMKADLRFLASEECEGRGIETEGINKAADYIADQFRKIGLKTAKGDDNYFMPFTIKGSAKQTSPGKFALHGPLQQKIEFSTRDFSVCGLTESGKVATGIVFVGYGITSGDKKYDDYAGIDVKGKLVVILRKTPRDGNDKAPFPDADRFSPLIEKIRNAEEHKAAGVIFVNDRSFSKKSDELMAFDAVRGSDESASTPVIHVHRDLVDKMLAGSDQSLAQIEADIDRDLKPRSLELKNWKAEVETAVTRPVLKAKNVIGVLEGKGPLANETVVIGAHYDHLGRGERGSLAKGSKSIHFGADDNGSGTTGVLELARRLAANKERQGRRIVFMLFSGEERGLRGSAYYTKNPLFPLKDTTAMINLDMIGRLPLADDKNSKSKLEIGGVGSAEGFDKLVDKLNEKYKFDLKKTKSGMGPSDHASFYPKQVPVFFYFTQMHPDYHRPTDTVDKINFDGMKKICDMVEELALDMASVKERPKYVAGATGSGIGGSGGGGVPRIAFQPGEYDDDETKGVPVGAVTKDGPADKAGMKAGDWIVEIGGRPVKNMGGYMTAMRAAKPGQVIEIIVDREGKKVPLKVTPE